MAMGKAVLASDVGGHRELIEHERTGLLFKAEDPDDFIQQATGLARDSSLRDRIGDAGRRFVTEKRDWSKLVQRYLGIYEELLSAKRIEHRVGHKGLTNEDRRRNMAASDNGIADQRTIR
jgi:glycosyltransferase involved in cell wall biosynthesis